MSMLRRSPSSSPYFSAQSSYRASDHHNETLSTFRNNQGRIAGRSSNHNRGGVAIKGSGGGTSHSRANAPQVVASAGSDILPTSAASNPASPVSRAKRARDSPETKSSAHPVHKEYSSPRSVGLASAPTLDAPTSTPCSIGTGVATFAATPLASQTTETSPKSLYVDAGTQYTPPDFPPTSLRSSLHPTNRAVATEEAAQKPPSKLVSSDSSTASGISSSSSTDDQKPPRKSERTQNLSSPVSADLGAQTRSSAAGHSNAAEVASGRELATLPIEASPPESRSRVRAQLSLPNDAESSSEETSTAPAAGAVEQSHSSSSSVVRSSVIRSTRTAGGHGSTHSSLTRSSTSQSGSTDAHVQLLPTDYSQCDASVLARLVADMLMELIQFNDQIPLQDGHLTRFHSRAAPGISVHDYLARLTFHATLSPPILLSMVFLIDKLCLLYPAFTINSLTVHRFLITAATVASKGLSDSFWTNSTYARCGGVSVRELAMLEIELLSRVQWRIVPHPEALSDYYINLVARNAAFEIEPSTRTERRGRRRNESDDDDGTIRSPMDIDTNESP